MSKIASSCENCIWGKRYPEAEKPNSSSDRLWAELPWTRKLFKDKRWLDFEVAILEDKYTLYVNYRKCTRFPNFIRKHKDDFCGEHQPALEKMTEDELLAGLDNLYKS